MLGFGDQALSSLSNAAISVFAAATLSAGDFGRVSLIFAIYLVANGTVRSITSDVLIVRFSNLTEAGAWPHVRDALTVSLAAGTAIGAAIIGCGLVVGGPTAAALCILGASMPALALQDAMRFGAMAVRRPGLALANDGIWFVAAVAGVILLIIAGRANVFTYTAVWAGSGVGAALIVAATSPLRPGGSGEPVADVCRSWLRAHRDLFPQFTADLYASQAAGPLSIFIVAAVAGSPAAGALRAAQLPFSVLTVFLNGARLAVVPELVRALSVSAGAWRRVVMGFSIALGVLAAFWSVVVLALPDSLMSRVFGASWPQASGLLVATSFSILAISVSAAFFVGIRSLADATAGLRARLLSAISIALCVYIGAQAGGAHWAAIGLAIGAAIGAGICALQLQLSWRAYRARVAAAPDQTATYVPRESLLSLWEELPFQLPVVDTPPRPRPRHVAEVPDVQVSRQRGSAPANDRSAVDRQKAALRLRAVGVHGGLLRMVVLCFVGSAYVSRFSLVAEILLVAGIVLALIGLLGRPYLVKPSAWAFMYLAFWTASCFVSGGYRGTGGIVTWLNDDGHVLVAMLPLIALGNVAPTPADIAWIRRCASVLVRLTTLLFLAAVADPALHHTLIISGVFEGLASSHHVVGYIFGTCLIGFPATRRFASAGATKLDTLLAAVLVAVSGSRTTLLALCVVVLWLFVRYMRSAQRIKMATAMIVGLIVVVVGVPQVRNSVSLLSSNSFSLSGSLFEQGFAQDSPEYIPRDAVSSVSAVVNAQDRFGIFGFAIGRWAASPLVGIGSGRIDDYYPSYTGVPGVVDVVTNGEDQPGYFTAHDSYLLVLSENGLVGLILLLGIFFSAFRAVRGSPKRIRTFTRALVIFMLVTGFTGATLQATSLTLDAGVVLMLMLGIARQRDGYDVEEASPRSIARRPAGRVTGPVALRSTPPPVAARPLPRRPVGTHR